MVGFSMDTQWEGYFSFGVKDSMNSTTYSLFRIPSKPLSVCKKLIILASKFTVCFSVSIDTRTAFFKA